MSIRLPPLVQVGQRKTVRNADDTQEIPGSSSLWLFPLLPFLQHRPSSGRTRWETRGRSRALSKSSSTYTAGRGGTSSGETLTVARQRRSTSPWSSIVSTHPHHTRTTPRPSREQAAASRPSSSTDSLPRFSGRRVLGGGLIFQYQRGRAGLSLLLNLLLLSGRYQRHSGRKPITREKTSSENISPWFCIPNKRPLMPPPPPKYN